MKRQAFTLIELLVVIAIIAILAAILFPVFAQAKAAAKKTQGLAQAKQIGTATKLYLSDNDDVFPRIDWNNGVPHEAPLPDGRRIYQGWVVWPLLLFPYLKNTGIYVSPMDVHPKNPGWAPQDDGVVNPYRNDWGKPIPMSYGANTDLTWRDQGLTETAIQFPSSTYWIADIMTDHTVGFGSWWNGWYSQEGTFNRVLFAKGSECGDAIINTMGRPALRPGADPRRCTRYDSGQNFVFADSHAKYEDFRKSDGWFANPDRASDQRDPNNPRPQ